MEYTIPSYLKSYENLYKKNPRQANLEWFKNANYGLFIHYGLFSLLNRHEWVQLREKIYVKDYAKLKEQFTAENFDAEYIVKMAKDCNMKYINITTRHHDSFCLWDTKETDFNSLNSPAKRDLVKELAEACEKYGLGLFLYYSHGRDWKHPHAPNNDKWGGSARPIYDPAEPTYAYGKEHDLNIYLDFMKDQISELLTNYPTIAGIWLDGIATPLSGDDTKFKCQDLYDHIHTIHPHALVSYKQGVTGTEDFFAPEHTIPTNADDAKKAGKIYSKHDKIIEICTTTLKNPGSWGCNKDSEHKTVDEILEQWNKAKEKNAHLLLNTGPLPDGSLHPADEKIFHQLAKYIKS